MPCELVRTKQIKGCKGQERNQPPCCTPIPLSPNPSRKLGGTVKGGVQECAGSPLLKCSSLLGSNCSHTLANKHIHTYTQHTQKDRLHEEVKEHSHPAGCSLSVLISMFSRTLLAFEAVCRYDIFANIPHSFRRTFACP